MMKGFSHFALALVLATPFLIQEVSAQQPTPAQIVVQAATAPSTAVAVKPVAPEASSSISAAIKALQETRSTNAETLKKQAALLDQLDELLKAAEQLKVFSKRG